MASQLFLAFLEDGYPLADLKERWKVQEASLVIEASVIPWTAVPHVKTRLPTSLSLAGIPTSGSFVQVRPKS
jgi:hypothetical protein